MGENPGPKQLKVKLKTSNSTTMMSSQDVSLSTCGLLLPEIVGVKSESELGSVPSC